MMIPDTPGQRKQTPRIILAVLLSGVGGCVSGSLATDTDLHALGYRWSDAGRQMVHVGETVEFDFVLQDLSRRFVPPLGLADYCVAVVDGERLESEPNTAGHFQFAYTFDQVTPGDEIEVRATAYRQQDHRDFMRIREKWIYAESPFNRPDRKVAADSIRLTVYQAPIELAVVRPPDDLDPESGVLRIRRADGSTSTVYVDRPRRPGFAIAGPEPDGYYRVSYLPSGDELNPVGTTEVEFEIYDTAGFPHYASTMLETP